MRSKTATSFTSGLVSKISVKRTQLFIFLVILTLGGIARVYCDNVQSEIKNYEATITILDKNDAVDVGLEITYSRLEGGKSSGFKDFGFQRPTKIIGNDDKGLFPVQLIRKKGYKIAWSIPPQDSGEKKIRIKFKLLDVLTSKGQSNVLSLPWVGAFQTPVRHVLYRIIFPVGFEPIFQEVSCEHKVSQDSFGRTILTIEGSHPSIPESLTVVFSPAIVEVSSSFKPVKQFLESYRLEIIIGFVVALFLVSTFVARKFNQES